MYISLGPCPCYHSRPLIDTTEAAPTLFLEEVCMKMRGYLRMYGQVFKRP